MARENNATRGARRRAQTSGAILDAAERTFAGVGYRRARVEDVAEAADVSVGAIYSHFGNKDGLYLAVAERAVDLFGRYLRQAFQEGWAPLEQVVAAGDAYLRFHLEHPGSFRFLALEEVEEAAAGPAEQGRAAAGITAILDELSEKIQEAVDAGEARPVDARSTARFLWGAWNGTIGLGACPGLVLTDEDIRRALDQGRLIVLAGLSSELPP